MAVAENAEKPPSPSLPRAAEQPVAKPAVAAPFAAGAMRASNENGDEAEKNPIFDALVSQEGEVAGLVAYSIYKQNKRAWLNDFLKATGRPPTDAESRAYIIGESTERRLATYRHLAAATLSGAGPDAPGAGRRTGAVKPGLATTALWVVVLLTALGVLALALHAGLGGAAPR